ncbi:MAG: AAA family ATPase [Bacteroidales bacterium]|nr:AAA family ATPase [Bacteroidales bacterium]
MRNERIELARRYVEETGVSLFLTGKAGTGKTTFLREVDANCKKRHVVVAPTGVAAVNAGGVTIHSFFQLPFSPYLPDIKELVTEYQMPEEQRRMNKTKLDIIRSLELLIIDEVSMVRADLLDAIDMTLRRYRRSSRPFGGVQLLMIGDVHQLPPVVAEGERAFVERVYPSPFFFNSKALQRLSYVTIELTQVYRQQDEDFVTLLNRVRNNQLDADTLAALNRRVDNRAIGQTNAVGSADGLPQAVVLTTHNRQADAINNGHMAALVGESRKFEARVEGTYPESMMAVDRLMELKVGERVMFVKNDSTGAQRYYNGKLGTVDGFVTDEKGGSAIGVNTDDGEYVEVGLERWDNMTYVVGRDNEIKQETIGSFYQFPLRPAWAVTIHKAQGLTFDRVEVNAADAFAYGQVYVALSRCRSLEGLTLTTPLTQSVAFADREVEEFIDRQPTFEQAAAAAQQYEAQYYMEQLTDLYSMEALAVDTGRVADVYARLRAIYPQYEEKMRAMRQTMEDLASVGERFRNQLMHLSAEQHADRIAKASAYFSEQLSAFQAALSVLLEVEVDNKENARLLKEAGDALKERLGEKLACMRAVRDNGFSVRTVQKAKVDTLLGPTTKTKRGKPAKREGSAPKLDDDDRNALVQMLRQWRKEKSEESGLPIFMVLQQKSLMGIVTTLPQSERELLAVEGVGKGKVALYGKEILGIVADFCEIYGVRR